MRRQITSSLLVLAALTGSTILAGCQTTQERAQRRPAQNADRMQARDDASQNRDATQNRTQTRAEQNREAQNREAQNREAQNRDMAQSRSDDMQSTDRTAEMPTTAGAGTGGGTVAPPAVRTVSGWPTRSGGGMNWTTLAYPTGNPRTSALGVEKGMPRQVRLNQEFEYQIVVTNLADFALDDVVVTDTADSNLRIVSSMPAGQTSGGNYMWNLGDLGPRQSETIRVRAIATAQGTVGTCATATYASALCGTSSVVAPSLRLTKSGPAEILRCEKITYTFEVTNTGSGSINNVVINDPLPAGLTSGGAQNITINAGSLAAGETKSFTRPATASRTGRFDNSATAEGDGLTARSGSVTTVVRAPVLRISKTCVDKTFIGKEIEYRIAVSNTGDGEARDVVVEDMMPAGVSFVSASDGGRAAGNKVTWNLGTIAPNATRNISMRVGAGSAGTYRNTATARAYCAEGVSDTCETVVTGIPAILLEVIDVEDPVRVGNNETYVITVTNQGSAPDTNIAIVVTLEPSQTFVSAGGATQGRLAGNTVTFQPIATLAPKARAEFRLVVRAASAGDVRLTVTMNSDQLTREVRETEATNQYE